jgi:hypothetical protein
MGPADRFRDRREDLLDHAQPDDADLADLVVRILPGATAPMRPSAGREVSTGRGTAATVRVPTTGPAAVRGDLLPGQQRERHAGRSDDHPPALSCGLTG